MRPVSLLGDPNHLPRLPRPRYLDSNPMITPIFYVQYFETDLMAESTSMGTMSSDPPQRTFSIMYQVKSRLGYDIETSIPFSAFTNLCTKSKGLRSCIYNTFPSTSPQNQTKQPIRSASIIYQSRDKPFDVPCFVNFYLFDSTSS